MGMGPFLCVLLLGLFGWCNGGGLIDGFPILCWPLPQAAFATTNETRCKQAEYEFITATKLLGSCRRDDNHKPKHEEEEFVVVDPLGKSSWEFAWRYASRRIPVVFPLQREDGALQCEEVQPKPWQDRHGSAVDCPKLLELVPFSKRGVLEMKEYRVFNETQVFGLYRSVLGLHRLLFVASGRIDVFLCDENAQKYLETDGTEYKGDLFTSPLSEAKRKCLRTEVDFTHGVFIPGNFVYMWRANRHATVVDIGFVDAFNFNDVVEASRLFRLKTPFQGFQHAWVFETNAQMLLPKATIMTHRSKFKQWQKQRKHDFLVTIVSPLAFQSTLMRVGRDFFTIELKIHSDVDHAQYFVDVEWRRIPSQPPLMLFPAVSNTKKRRMCWRSRDWGMVTNNANAVEHTIDGLWPSNRYTFRVRWRSVAFASNGRWSDWSVPISTKAESTPEPPIRVAIASSDTTSVDLEWDPSPDDGGMPILHYLIVRKEHSSGVFEYAGTTNSTRTNVHNLRPGRSHVFKVAAVNELGVGGFSRETEPQRTAMRSMRNKDTKVVLGGQGSEKHPNGMALRYIKAKSDHYIDQYGMHVFVNHGHEFRIGFDIPCTSSLVILSDRDQTLELSEEAVVIHGWRSHHSPQAYDVHAEIVRAVPFHGCVDRLKHPHLIHNRIAVLERGSCSFYSKALVAQSHGAIGVIIVDGPCDSCAKAFDNRCVLGSSKQRGEGFASHDPRRLWDALHIPVLLIKHSDLVDHLETVF